MHNDGSEAEHLFAQWLDARDRGAAWDFDSFCREHPAESEELHEMFAELRAVERTPRTTAPAADSPIEAATSEDWHEFLDRLREFSPRMPRYRLIREIDRGGMGIVLEVRDDLLHRNLAMKVIRRLDARDAETDVGSVDPRLLGRFLEEAQVTAQLEHPAIIPVHEIGLDDRDRIYFTMKLVKDGESLSSIFAKVRDVVDGWSTTAALNVLLRACEAVEFAHSRGVLHRDLKPSNVMVGRFGEVYVLDWGIARVLGRPTGASDDRVPSPHPESIVRSERQRVASTRPRSAVVSASLAPTRNPDGLHPRHTRSMPRCFS